MGEEVTQIQRTGKRILVVDDDPGFLAAMVRSLDQHYGYELSLAPNASAAIILGRCRRFDAAIVDVYLCGSSGLELVPQLRREYARRHQGARLPVILVSGDDPHGWGELLDEADVDAFVRKPLAVEDLVLLLESFFDK